MIRCMDCPRKRTGRNASSIVNKRGTFMYCPVFDFTINENSWAIHGCTEKIRRSG